MTLSGFGYVMVGFEAESEPFGCSIDPEGSQIGIERFESAYYLFFLDSRQSWEIAWKKCRCFALCFSLNISHHSQEFKIANGATIARGIIFVSNS